MNKYKNYFHEISNYLNNNLDIVVVLTYNSDGDFWFPALRRILINKNNQWRERYYALLHESGHARLDIESEKMRSMKMVDQFKENIRSKKDFVSLLNEEILAWNIGKSLAFQLGHDINSEKYNKTKTSCIMSYVKAGLKDLYKSEVNVDIINP